jgi:hypothetical protein
MPLSSILVLTGIVAAFTVFGVVLAWGDYQTRHIRDETDAADHQVDLKKAA